MPHDLRQVWRWFVDLNETRRYQTVGEKSRALRIERREIYYWAQTRDVLIESWQLAAIELIDDVFVRIANGDKTIVSSATFTPQLFHTLLGK